MGFLSSLFKKKNKSVVIGLDGTPHSLITKFINDGTMPNLAQLIKNGSLYQMDSSIPEISSVAWSSFMTGTNPANHNILGFVDLKENSYDLMFPNFSNLKTPTIWDEIAKNEKRSIIINLPSTYPAKQINGILIAGFVAPNLEKAVYPASILPLLKEMKYLVDVDFSKAQKNPDEFIKDLFDSLDIRIKTILHFWDNEKWDFLTGILTGTDRLHHFLWQALEEPDHKYHDTFINFYKKIDDLFGKILSRMNENIQLFVMSDHGFTRLKKQVYLNYWLKEKGYLNYEKFPPDSLNDMTSDTKAFVIEPSRLFINLKGKFPKGNVEKNDYEKLRDDISAQLSELKDADGNLMINRVYKKEEVYSGPYLNKAADLLIISNHGYDLKGSIKKDCLTEDSHFTGMHTQDDAFIASNKELNFSKKPSISDLKPIIIEQILK